MSNKSCEIINDRFCFILKVDDESISFNGFAAADYFENHYKSLGYEIIKTDKYNDEDD